MDVLALQRDVRQLQARGGVPPYYRSRNNHQYYYRADPNPFLIVFGLYITGCDLDWEAITSNIQGAAGNLKAADPNPFSITGAFHATCSILPVVEVLLTG